MLLTMVLGMLGKRRETETAMESTTSLSDVPPGSVEMDQSQSNAAASSAWFGLGADSLGWQQEAFNELLLLLSSRSHSRKQRALIHDRIAQLLTDCTGEELDAILLSSDLSVFIKLSTMQTMSVVRNRLSEVSIGCKAQLLQEFNTARRYKNIIHFNFWAQFVREIFHTTKGLQLTVLKNAIDSSGSWKNLFNLIYEEFNIIGGKDLRDEILQHIKREAAHVRRTNAIATAAQAGSSGPQAKPRIKIISDLDDTVWCSGGKFPAGCDRTYPAHSFYPGIFALYKEVTIGSEAALTELNAFAQPAAMAGNLDAPSASASASNLSPTLSPPPSPGGSLNSSRQDVLMRYSRTPQRDHRQPGRRYECQEEPASGGNLVRSSAFGQPTVECDGDETLESAFKKLSSKAGRPVASMHVSPAGALGGNGAADGSSLQDHSLVMLSARPGVKAAKGFFESMMYRKFIKLKEQGYFNTMPTLLPGSLIAGTKATIMGFAGKFAKCVNVDNRIVWKEVAHKKYKDMVKYMELYPEYDFLFFGDDGQGDVQVAINAIKNPKLAVMGPGPRLSDVFIHRVLRPDALKSRPDIHSPTPQDAAQGRLGTSMSLPDIAGLQKAFR